MKKSIRFTALLLCLAVMAGCLAACGTKAVTPSSSSSASSSSAASSSSSAPASSSAASSSSSAASSESDTGLPLVKSGTDAKLTIGIQQNAKVENYDTNAFTKWVEEKTGVKLEFVYFSSDNSEAATQLSLMISSGEKLPDIIWDNRGITQAQMFEYGEDGYFLDLSKYFADQKYTKFFNEGYSVMGKSDKENLFALATDPKNGALYAFPDFEQSVIDSCATLVEINKNWLTKVGAQKPATVDELYEVLKKFASGDPNGNGKADEIAAMGYDGYRSDFSQYVVNAFVYCNDQYFFNSEKGKLWVPYNTDEYRKAMIYLNKLYTEGLLSPMTYTIAHNDSAQMKTIITPADNVALVGVAAAHPLVCFADKSPLIDEYTAMAPLKAATAKGGYACYMANTFHYYTFITKDCANPDLAFRFLDFLSGKEAFVHMRYGEESVDWNWAKAGDKDLYGHNALITLVASDVFTAQNNKNWHVVGSTLAPYTAYGGTTFTNDGAWTTKAKMLCSETVDAYASMKTPDEVVYNLVYNSEENETVSEVSTVLKDYIKQSRSEFATGVRDPNSDADWNAYLNDLNNQGISKWLSVAQTAYTRMLKG